MADDIVDHSEGPRNNDSWEPLFYHSYPTTFYLELLQVFPIDAVIDLTPGEGNLAFAAHQRNIKDVGLTVTQEHADRLQAHLDVRCLKAMLEEGHPLYDPMALATVKSGLPERPAPKPKPKPKPGPKGGPHKIPRVGPKEGGKEDTDDPMAEEEEDDLSNDDEGDNE